MANLYSVYLDQGLHFGQKAGEIAEQITALNKFGSQRTTQTKFVFCPLRRLGVIQELICTDEVTEIAEKHGLTDCTEDGLADIMEYHQENIARPQEGVVVLTVPLLDTCGIARLFNLGHGRVRKIDGSVCRGYYARAIAIRKQDGACGPHLWSRDRTFVFADKASI